MDAFHRLTEEHHALLERFEALEALEGPAQRAALAHLLAELRAHLARDEAHVLPWVARVEGHTRAREEHEELLTLAELAEELETLPAGGPDWTAHLLALEDVWVAHVEGAERQLHPRLRAALDDAQREALGHALGGRAAAHEARRGGRWEGTAPALAYGDA